eukprot:CAMPEP_0197437398 /NCGR_PEP_ID=MMETSP1175-20131217/4654_1 /TAXON_ID=1003142 /ORGANISM="Triceratium dubium, Strain CCMP147" /LENGTH=93 /DNA_ID=CAMNT_0042966913 /DNA_START=707 /DNA_END=989 /DNA_ORIENTATION=+
MTGASTFVVPDRGGRVATGAGAPPHGPETCQPSSAPAGPTGGAFSQCGTRGHTVPELASTVPSHYVVYSIGRHTSPDSRETQWSAERAQSVTR